MPKTGGVSFSENQYRDMTDEALQDVLRREVLCADAPDTVQLEQILAEMKRRGLNTPARSAEDAWAEFERDYAGTESCYDGCAPEPPDRRSAAKPPRIRRLPRRIAALAAVLAILMATLITAQASGLHLFSRIARWTEELFSFGAMEAEKTSADASWTAAVPDEGASFDSLQQALDAYGITEVAAPRWLPDGFRMEGATVEKGGGCVFFFSIGYDEAGKPLLIQYDYAPNGSSRYYEKTAADPIRFEHGGQEYILLENENNTAAAWVTEQFDCCISAPFDLQTMQTVLKSIY